MTTETTEPKRRHQHWPERTLCSVLEDMRSCHKTHNYSYLGGLIEEVQVLGNRMEAGLERQGNYLELMEKLGELKREYNGLVDEYNKVAKKKDRLKKVKEDED